MKKLIKKWLGIADYNDVRTKVENQLKNLSEEVFGRVKNDEGSRMGLLSLYSSMLFSSPTLKDEVRSQNEAINKIEKLVNLILEHFKLERVKITEENGGTHITEKLRPKKKEKKVAEKETDCCC